MRSMRSDRLSGRLFAALSACLALCAGAAGAASHAEPAHADSALAADAALADRVKDALEGAPFLYDRHIDVSVRDGRVVLSGFVFSDWDLRDALRIAQNAAKPYRVIDGLHIEEGGRR
jgi:hypothetical protein